MTHTRAIDGAGTTTTLTTNTTDPSITLTGTGRPGDSVAVTIGDRSQTTTVGTDGKWTATFPATGLPGDGSHTATATFTGGTSAPETRTGPGFVIDMTRPVLEVTDGTQSTGDIVNRLEHGEGVTLTGTTEPGAKVKVTIDGTTRDATVATDGTWTVTFTGTEVSGGDRTTSVTITATDPLLNTTTRTEVLVLDTIDPPLTLQPMASDDTVNRVESLNDLVIGGTAAPNSTVTITIEGLGNPVTRLADANGNWTLPLSGGTFPLGIDSRTVTVTTSDAAGNVTTLSRELRIDTELGLTFGSAPIAGDNTVNLQESRGTITLTGTTDLDAQQVTLRLGTTDHPATLAGDGTWSVTLPAGAFDGLRDSAFLTISARDAAGNTASATRTVKIDLESALTVETAPVGPEGILSGPERAAGFTLDGTAEAGSQIFLSLNGTAFGPITANADGIWAHGFSATDLAALNAQTGGTITAYAIDPAGNRSDTVTRSFAVDTGVDGFTFTSPDLRGTVNDGPRDPSVLNAIEREQGIVLQGSVEPGSAVTLQVGTWSTTIPGSATASGSWTFRLPAEALPQGAATTATIIATATDPQGNISAPISQTIAIDTTVTGFDPTQIRLGTGGDGILNAREHLGGLPVSGLAEPGATVQVIVNGHTRSAVAAENGTWSVTFTSSQIPTGEVDDIPVRVSVTDTAGNTRGPYDLSFGVDTIAPDTPTVIEAQDVAGAMRGFTTLASDDSYVFHRVDATGAPVTLRATEFRDAEPGEDLFRFANGQTVPDGSYLVINTTDTAGNEANTLFIKNTTTGVEVDLDREGLAAFDLAAIDLTRAPDARLTITEDQLLALTGPDKTLLIKGEDTDQVTIADVTRVQHNQLINGTLYDVYTLGTSGAQILLEDDVSRNTI
ncbi:MAG: hypothetical protein H9533_18080 [Rhodobacteraceae bacterium]|nr:hypothetical protein [Paracoccaceae bacterium]